MTEQTNQTTVLVKDEAGEMSPGDVAVAFIEASRLVLVGGMKRHPKGWYVVVEKQEREE